jgi:hypothetical protein
MSTPTRHLRRVKRQHPQSCSQWRRQRLHSCWGAVSPSSSERGSGMRDEQEAALAGSRRWCRTFGSLPTSLSIPRRCAHKRRTTHRFRPPNEDSAKAYYVELAEASGAMFA